VPLFVWGQKEVKKSKSFILLKILFEEENGMPYFSGEEDGLQVNNYRRMNR